MSRSCKGSQGSRGSVGCGSRVEFASSEFFNNVGVDCGSRPKASTRPSRVVPAQNGKSLRPAIRLILFIHVSLVALTDDMTGFILALPITTTYHAMVLLTS